MKRTALLCLMPVFLLAAPAAVALAPRHETPGDPIAAALQSLGSPLEETARWTYIMNVRVRLLLFWVGADDVGGGYIAKGTLPADPLSHAISLVIGSDPAKAPRKINHWGAASEIQRNDGAESAFFGFMKSSKAASAREAESETARKDRFAFEANLAHSTANEVFSRTVPIESTRDFTFRDLRAAQQAMTEVVSGPTVGRVRTLEGSRPGCVSTRGFLGALERIIDRSLVLRTTPLEECYVHNARYYKLSLKRTGAIDARHTKVKLRQGGVLDASYQHLISENFEILNSESGERTLFELVIGSTGALRGVPVEIHYQPNWWFQVVLHLEPRNSQQPLR